MFSKIGSGNSFSARLVFVTDRAHNTRQPPLCAEESVAVKASFCIQSTVQHVNPYHIGVHGVGVLPHGSLDDSLPGVTAEKKPHQLISL